MNKTRILIVEDEILVARDLEQQLTALGYLVVGIAASGEDALALIAEHQPQLVLMDIRLQGEMDGIATAEEVRNRFSLPVIFLTAHADQATVQRARVTEPFGYILKPFDERELNTIVEMAIYKHAAGQKLRASERRYATTLQSIGDAVIAVDIEGNVTFMNTVAERLTGWPLTEAEGHSLTDVFQIVNEHTYQPVENPVWRVLREGITVGLANHTILQNRHGQEIPIDDSAAPILDDHGECTGVVLVFHDITVRKQAEEKLRETETQLQHSHKMDAIGQLAAGIAHDFNNQLTVINGYSRMLAHALQGNDALLKYVERIISAGERSEELTQQLLAYSRRQVLQQCVINLNDIVTSTGQLLSRLIGEHIVINTSLDPALASIEADPAQLEQVLMNLVINARDAMSTGGEITIRTINTTLTAEHLHRFPELPPGPYVTLIVEDTGCGMDKETLARIFEPFFTTKVKGKGSGLGLAMAFGVIKQSGGDIHVKSKVGEGTQFTILLPSINGNPPDSNTDTEESAPEMGNETILVVDDEESIRDYVGDVLTGCGYHVALAANGAEALELSHQHPGQFQLLLTDILMPQMNGWELATQMIEQRKSTKVLFMSGYTKPPQQTAQWHDAEINLLTKPFTPDELTHRIRSLLDSAPI